MRIISTHRCPPLLRYIIAVQLCQVQSIIAARCSSSGYALHSAVALWSLNRARLSSHNTIMCKIKGANVHTFNLSIIRCSNLIEKCEREKRVATCTLWVMRRTNREASAGHDEMRCVCIMKWNKETWQQKQTEAPFWAFTSIFLLCRHFSLSTEKD